MIYNTNVLFMMTGNNVAPVTENFTKLNIAVCKTLMPPFPNI